MSAAFRAELFKIGTTRLFAGLLAVGTGMTLIVSVVSAGRAGSFGRIPALSSAAGLRDVATDVIFGLVLSAVFGAALTSGEFRHRTATDTYLCEPRRLRVLAAQVGAAGLAGAGFGLGSAAAATAVAMVFAMGKGPLALGPADLIGFAAGAAVAGALLAAAGAAAGALIRSQLAAVAAIFVWWIGVELVVPGLSAPAGPYLPFTAAETMAGVRTGGGMPPLLTGENALPFVVAAVLLAAAVVLLLVAAAAGTVRRDVV